MDFTKYNINSYVTRNVCCGFETNGCEDCNSSAHVEYGRPSYGKKENYDETKKLVTI